MRNNNKVILLATHYISEPILRKYTELSCKVGDKYDVILLYNCDDRSRIKDSIKVSHFISDIVSLNRLGYEPIEESIVPGSAHFPVLNFYLTFPIYDLYWFIEYDVVFTGEWDTLLEDVDRNLRQYDYLASHVERYSPKLNSSWDWWRRENNVGYPINHCIKAFHPICRYSNQALRCLDEYMKRGYSAHSEVMIPTCLYYHGMRLGDFGGQGEFVPDSYQDKYYRSDSSRVNGGTMRYRPLYTREEIEACNLKNTLFHPLKK